MAFFLMIVSLLVKHYFPHSNQYVSELPIYLFLILILLYLLQGNRVYAHNLINTRIIIFIFFASCIQLIAIFFSYIEIGSSIYNRNPIAGFASFCFFILAVFLHYYVVKFLINNLNDIKLFIKGTLWSTLIILFVSYAQLLYIFSPNITNNLMTFFGTFFEARNPYTPEWYLKGSYVQTLGRINGFFSESAKLVAYLSVVCLPFVLASIKNKYNLFNIKRKYNPLFYYTLLSLILGILLLAKTSTGILAILIVLSLFWISLPLKRKISSGFIFAAFFILLIALYNNNSYIYSVIQDYVFGKTDSTSTDNRLGGTIALFQTFIHNPIIGVGQAYTDYYIYNYTPKWSTDNAEFQHFVNVRHAFPIFSIFLGWLAQYGLIICIFVFNYIIKLVRSTSKLVEKTKSLPEYQLYKTIKDSLILFLAIFFPLSFLTFGWNESGVLIMFFFFVVFRQHLERVVAHNPY